MVTRDQTIIHEFDTSYGHYQIVDMSYDGRPARVLFSGDQRAAQSGVALDENPDLLFDYNQRFFELVEGAKPARVLLIGGGMYTLPTALLRVLPETVITVIELDAELAPIAAIYFDLQLDERLIIIHDDGFAYLKQSAEQYDMVIIDAYVHASAEPTLANVQAVSLIRKVLAPNGIVAVNSIATYYGRRSEKLHQLLGCYESAFSHVEVYPASQGLSLWLPQNLILIASNFGHRPEQYLRHNGLGDAPEPFDIQRDLSR